MIEGTGAWLGDGRTFKVDAVVADAGVDVDQVKIDITVRMTCWQPPG